MSNQPEQNNRRESEFSQKIGEKAKRKLDAQQQVNKTIWFGFGWFGLVGWSVAMPTLLGIFAGLWLDSHYPGPHSWTLTLLIAGLMLGCWNAWSWIANEETRIHKHQDKNDE